MHLSLSPCSGQPLAINFAKLMKVSWPQQSRPLCEIGYTAACTQPWQAILGQLREASLNMGNGLEVSDLQIIPLPLPTLGNFDKPNSKLFSTIRGSPMDRRIPTFFLVAPTARQTFEARMAEWWAMIHLINLTSCQMTRKLYLECLTRGQPATLLQFYGSCTDTPGVTTET